MKTAGQRSGSRPSKPSLDLAAEAAEMEAKLAELKKAMEREREKREKSTTDSTGAHWRSGASSGLPLRGQIRAKAGGSVSSTPAGSSPPSAHGSRAPSALPSHKPTAPVPIQYPSILQSPEDKASAVSHGSPYPGGSPMMPRVAAASRLYGSPAAGSPAVLGMEVQSVAMPQVPVPYKPAVGGYRVGGALGSSPRRAEILAIHTNEAVETGIACSAGDGQGLGTGAFNEAESHKSFLEALNEWRSANKGNSAAPQQQQQVRQGHTNTGGTGAEAAPSMEVQTEPRAAAGSRPLSARAAAQLQGQPLSYFDRLVLNSASRTAGQAASGQPDPVPTSPHHQPSSLLPLASPAHTHGTAGVSHVSHAGSSIPSLPALQGSTSFSGSGRLSGAGHLSQQQHTQPQQPSNSVGITGSSHSNHPSIGGVGSNSMGRAPGVPTIYSLDAAFPAPHSQGCSANGTPGSWGGAGNSIGGGGAGGSTSQQPPKHKGLDILEELERLELQQQLNLAQYDSDDDLLTSLTRTGGSVGSGLSRRGAGGAANRGDPAGAPAQRVSSSNGTPQIVTHTGFLTRAARLPDAVLVPNEDMEDAAGNEC